ncbi:MAG: RagB/SusD family nutrient uptake outer membrane protein [Bacteroidales bacterium]|nr:RagB/SusD family nutrient uptake outer membrane protein [Bacteroidales bacterium]
MPEKTMMIKAIFTALIAVFVISCDDYLDVNPEEVIIPEQHFKDKDDADAAINGIYGELMGLAPHYIILNELRADLMDITNNADYFLRQVNLHEVTADNPYTDPQPFFRLINECNDILRNFYIMSQEKRLSSDDYNQRYSDIATLRSWLFYQLVIHYGSIPYITDPIDDVDDLASLYDETYPVLDLSEMIDTLLVLMEALPYKKIYNDENLVQSVAGYYTRFIFIDKEIFLGDLNLWKNNYTTAASYYKTAMERDNDMNEFDSYKVPYSGDPYTLDKYNSGYYRYYYWNIDSAINHWPWMFMEDQTSDFFNEWYWVIFYHYDYEPVNPFIRLFSLTAGNYYFKPSASIMENWNAQIQRNGFKGDFRGNTGSYTMINGQPEITKFIMNYNMNEPFQKEGKWFLYRAGGVHLRYCEAANRDGKHKVAYSLINNGIETNYGQEGATDLTYLEQTLLPYPYDFDARKAESGQIPVGARGLWHRNAGIRGRVYLENLEVPVGEDSLMVLEDHIIDEAGRELAFEGHRWEDLVRIAMRRGKPEFLADRIYLKLQKGGYAEAEAVRTKLLDPQNWFLPFPDSNK